MTAPVCLVEPQIDIKQPDPRTAPSIPNATDLQSALAAINALRNYLQWLTNHLPPKNNYQPNPNDHSGRGSGRNGGSGGGFTTKNGIGKYTEVHRQVKTVRVFNQQDKSQYVDVEQIYALNFVDNKTGETWTWKR